METITIILDVAIDQPINGKCSHDLRQNRSNDSFHIKW